MEYTMKTLPYCIVERMLFNQKKETGERNIKSFRSISGGFAWHTSPEGFSFWESVLCYNEFGVFYRKYNINKDILKYPYELVELILKRQEEAGNRPDISIFVENLRADTINKGFDWEDTPEGVTYWCNILDEGNIANYRLNDYFKNQLKLKDSPIEGKIVASASLDNYTLTYKDTVSIYKNDVSNNCIKKDEGMHKLKSKNIKSFNHINNIKLR